ncbi:hypothetical protein D3C84_1222350 [compost metagenome]
MAGHHLAKLGLPLAAESAILLAITATGCWATYEIARRIGWFGLLLGVRPDRKASGRVGSGGPEGPTSAAHYQAANLPPRAA